MNGKGSKQRPRQVRREEYEDNWDRVFKQNKQLNKEESSDEHTEDRSRDRGQARPVTQ